MDKLTKLMSGRARLAVMLMVSLVLVVALPTMAFAWGYFSEYPVDPIHGQPAVVSVDVVGTTINASTAVIKIDGAAQKTFVATSANIGQWISEENLQADGSYRTTWTWDPTQEDGGLTKYTLSCYPATLAYTAHAVTAQFKTQAGLLVSADSWSFTMVAPVVIPPVTPPAAFDNTTCTTASACHIHTLATYANDQAMGPDCWSCHHGNFTPEHGLTPSKSSMGTAHVALTAYINASPSKACTACHGNDVMGVATKNADNTFTVPNIGGTTEHNNCSCHQYGEAESLKACTDCHDGVHGTTHGWSKVSQNVSGHNTTAYGTVGAHEKWDGSEGIVVKNSANDTITQEWPLPTASVFWSQSARVGTDSVAVAMANRGGDAAALTAAVRTDVGWGSVITCEDCHTGLAANEANGPHGGATIAMDGLDPLFPDDWKLAELSTFDPTGMRSVATTAGSANPYYKKQWDTDVATSTTTAGNGYSFGDVPGRFICQKCHKLTDTKAGFPSQNRAGRSKQGQGVSNSAHMEHHTDAVNGQANCVSCHIGLPHGWTRPRLLVYSTDSAPYLAAQPTTQTAFTVGGVSYKGNWNYGAGSSHLDSIYGGVYTAPAVPGFGKELVAGPAAGGWNQAKTGVEWLAPGSETGENEGQPNCNACSATGATHTTASEGVPAGAPTWK